MSDHIIKKVKITKGGLEALKSELKVLVEEKRPKIIERLSFARSQGDLSENSDYTNAKEELEFLDGKIEELKSVIKNALVVTNKKSNGSIDLGTKVTLKVNGVKTMYEIVGEWEANPVNKKISHSSPLGRALLGKKVGDKVVVEAPAGKIIYEILLVK